MAYDGARRVDLVHCPGDSPGSPLQVRVGDEVVITLHGSLGYGWTPVEVVAGPVTVIEAEATRGNRAGHGQGDRCR